MSKYHESDFEEAVIDCLREIGWDYAFGPDIERGGDYTNPRLDDRLEAALRRINPKAAPAAVRPMRRMHSSSSEPIRMLAQVTTMPPKAGVFFLAVTMYRAKAREAAMVRMTPFGSMAFFHGATITTIAITSMTRAMTWYGRIFSFRRRAARTAARSAIP